MKSGKCEKITLLLRTLGGRTNAAWPIINLIREYCNNFEVIVIDKALSAGTQICLGADTIIMPTHSFLSPIDPRQMIVDNSGMKMIEVEDIINYFDFGKRELRISNADMVEMVKEINKEISPTRLGSIYRTHELIEDISKKILINTHKQNVLSQKEKNSQKIDIKAICARPFDKPTRSKR